jgi:hypothetical protein
MKKAILSTEIGLRLRPSKFLWGWGGLFSMLVVFSLVYSLPWGWATLAVLAYLLACMWQWTQLPATRWPWSAQSVRVDVFGQMTLTDRRGQTWCFTVLPDTVVHPACIVLHITALVLQEGMSAMVPTPSTQLARWLRPKYLLILSDQADTQALQALRVWLKWGLRDESF